VDGSQVGPEGQIATEGFDSDIHLTGRLQLYLPHGDHPEALPQVIGARLKSDTTVFAGEGGSLMSLTQGTLEFE
jgi:hypothetical protein